MTGKKRTSAPRRKQNRGRAHLSVVPDQTSSELDPEQQELIMGLRRGLRSDSAYDLLAWVSGIVEAAEPRASHVVDDPERPGLPELVESFEAISFAETTAALTVIRELTLDDELRPRITRTLMRRRHPMPTWLAQLGEARVAGDVLRLSEPLGDGEDYFVPVRFADGQELTVVVFIDHNHGGAVKDGFVLPQPLDDVAAHFDESVGASGATLAPVDAAQARAVVERALRFGTSFVPQFESETWPMARPLVQWAFGLLPDGGVAPEEREWTEADVDRATGAFLASPYAKPIAHPEAEDLARLVLDWAAFHAGGDPLRWSPQRLSILLLDWAPRKVMAPQEYLAGIPQVLGPLVRYAHEARDVPANLTRDTLDALEEMTSDYLELIGDSGRQVSTGTQTLLDLLGLDAVEDLAQIDPGELGYRVRAALADSLGVGETMLQSLAAAVGGREQLDSLGVDPLPDEAFEWARVPEDVREPVRAWLDWCDRCADEMFDVEHRTAFRRFLARAAEGDPAIFRRRASVERGAAAIVWTVGRANLSVGWDGNVAVKDLMAYFGLKGSPQQRAEPLVRAIGADSRDTWWGLGDPGLLTGRRRAQIVADRDRWQAMP